MEDIFTIAKKLAEIPNTTDSKNWLIAKKFLYELNEPLLWAQTCLLAGTFTTDDVVKIWLLIEAINGWRRQPGKWDSELASKVLDDIRERIDILGEEHSRYRRLLSLWHYHAALVYHANGDFEKAMSCHQESSDLAETEKEKLISSFSAIIANINHLIFHNIYGELDTVYKSLNEIGAKLLEMFEGSESEDDLRWQANVICHLSWYNWIFNSAPVAESSINFLNLLPDNLKNTFEVANTVVQMIHLINNSKDFKEIIIEIIIMSKKVHLNSNADIDWRGFALIVEAQVSKQLGHESNLAGALLDLEERNMGGNLAKAISRMIFNKE
ncbi:hypothetical protein K8R66_04485 [bacterium]|nr:hypothetical protein [bacterium]